jgi:DNA-binding NarL/FixJ family response regulator
MGLDSLVAEDELVGDLAVGVARTAPSSAPCSSLDVLTAREREIASLVAAGHTNREIAHQLVLSDKTIQTHLRNIYAKLNLRSRVELTHTITQADKQPSTPNAVQGQRGDTAIS